MLLTGDTTLGRFPLGAQATRYLYLPRQRASWYHSYYGFEKALRLLGSDRIVLVLALFICYRRA